MDTFEKQNVKFVVEPSSMPKRSYPKRRKNFKNSFPLTPFKLYLFIVTIHVIMAKLIKYVTDNKSYHNCCFVHQAKFDCIVTMIK